MRVLLHRARVRLRDAAAAPVEPAATVRRSTPAKRL